MEQMNQELHELRDKLAAKVAEHDKTLAEHDEAISRLKAALGTIAVGLGSYLNGGVSRRGRNDNESSFSNSGQSGRQWLHEPANRPPRGGASHYKTNNRGGYQGAWPQSA